MRGFSRSCGLCCANRTEYLKFKLYPQLVHGGCHILKSKLVEREHSFNFNWWDRRTRSLNEQLEQLKCLRQIAFSWKIVVILVELGEIHNWPEWQQIEWLREATISFALKKVRGNLDEHLRAISSTRGKCLINYLSWSKIIDWTAAFGQEMFFLANGINKVQQSFDEVITPQTMASFTFALDEPIELEDTWYRLFCIF